MNTGNAHHDRALEPGHVARLPRTAAGRRWMGEVVRNDVEALCRRLDCHGQARLASRGWHVLATVGGLVDANGTRGDHAAHAPFHGSV